MFLLLMLFLGETLRIVRVVPRTNLKTLLESIKNAVLMKNYLFLLMALLFPSSYLPNENMKLY